MRSAKHYILFTGHMIDKPGRPAPRFPASKEQVAKKAIVEKLKKEVKDLRKTFFGIAGGACGGDILFHETAVELQIPTAIFLPMPKEEFVQQSVSFAGKQWTDRFHALCNRLPVHLMPITNAYPDDTRELTLWERSNSWMLHHALQNGADHMSLLTLYNGEKGDGAGGTAHMVNTVGKAGGRVIIIDTSTIFDL